MSLNPNQVATRQTGYASGDRSRQQLLEAALTLFAEYGIEGVSMRAIATEAGQANVSASQYYFGNKLNIVKAILEQIHEHIASEREQSLDTVSKLNANDPDYVKTVLTAAFTPHINLLLMGSWGHNAIRFLARVVWEAGEDGRQALIKPFGEDMKRVLALVKRGLPHVPERKLQLRFMFALGNLLHGLADLPILNNSPYGELLGKNQEHSATVLEEFMDYMVAGISH